MTIFAWVMFAVSAVLAAASLGSFLVFIFFDIPVWLDRARTLRRGLYMALLFWFNVWVWGRVVWTILHW